MLNRIPFTVAVMVIVLLTALTAASRVEPTPDTGYATTRIGPAALGEPALLAQPPAVIWRSTAGLEYQPLDDQHARRDILPYPDIHPRRWQAARSAEDSYHIVWLETDNRLRSALISTSGETLRGPILLAAGVQPNFVTLPAAEHRLDVLWLGQESSEISTLTIDAVGRPGPIEHFPARHVVQIAGTRTASNAIHLARLAEFPPGTWSVYDQVFDTGSLNVFDTAALHTFSMTVDQNITRFDINLDSTHGYILWSMADAERPDGERAWMLSFPLETPTDTHVFELTLPGTTALRDPQPIPGQREITGRWALSGRTPVGWQVGVVTLQQGALHTLEWIVPQPAGSGSLRTTADSSGALAAAWIGIDGAEPQLFVSQPTDLSGTAKSAEHVVSQTLAGAGIGIFLAVGWLILPGCLLWLVPDTRWTPLLGLVLYSTAKLIWPANLFSRLPPWLAALDLDRFAAPAWLTVITLLVASLGATGVWFWARGLDYRRRHLVYLLTDAGLTWLIFGANVLPS